MNNASRILYIDDNQDHLFIVQSMLKRDGYSCDTYSSAEKGLEVALSEPYDLILLDIQMPQLSGIDVLTQLKSRKEETGCRIVAITADSSVFSDKNPFEFGFDGNLSKPILPPDLSRMMKQLLPATTE